MLKKYKISFIGFLFAIILPIIYPITGLAAEKQITSNPSNQYRPLIYDNKIIWQDGIYNLYLYDLPSNSERQIKNNFDFSLGIDFYGNRIVFDDWGKMSNAKVYLYDLSTSSEQQFASTSDQFLPAIYDNKIVWCKQVWESSYQYSYNILQYDLATKTEKTIATNLAQPLGLDIYGNKIVWIATRGYEKDDIYLFDLSTGTERQVTANSTLRRGLKIFEDKIVWEDWRNGNTDIYLYNLTTNSEQQITNSWVDEYLGSIYGNYIVFSDKRTGNSDIYLYDLTTNTERQITTNSNDQYWPEIYGDKIVWTDWRNGNADIYLYDFRPPETQIDSGPSGTINTNSATFAFSGKEDGESGGFTYSYRLDNRSWQISKSPLTLKKLSVGNHTFEVKAIDIGGSEDPTPASKKFVYKPLLNLLITIKPKVIRLGKAIIISGQLKGAKGKLIANKKVVIKAKVLNKKKKKVKGKVRLTNKWVWKKLAIVKTDKNGKFAFKHKPKQTTIYKAEYAGDSNYKAATSKAVKVIVKKAKKKNNNKQ